MLTVLFATRNGEKTLPRMFDTMMHLEPPNGGWKIVAVENGSNDATYAILESWVKKLPLTILQSPEPGKNRALNLGLAAAEGDLIVLTDDDVLPAPDWLVQHRHLADVQPDADIFGGQIEPEWEIKPASWFLDQGPMGPLFALTDPQQPDGEIDPGMIWGPNMSVRTSVFARGARFDATIGPTNSPVYTMGSETEFTIRMAAAGHRCYFSNGIKVKHIIPKEALTEEWIMGRAQRFGRLEGRLNCSRLAIETQPPRMFGIPRWMLRRILELQVERVRSVISGDEAARFLARWQLNRLFGRIKGLKGTVDEYSLQGFTFREDWPQWALRREDEE